LISVRDSGGRYLFVNSTMAEFHGVPNAAFVGRTPERVGVPDYALGAFSAIATGEPVVVRDVPLVDATGHARRFDVVSRRLKAAGNAAGWLVLEVATEVAVAGAAQAADSPVASRTQLATEGLPTGAEPAAANSEGAAAAAHTAAARLADGGTDVDSRLDFVLRSGNLALIDWDVRSNRIAASAQLADLLGLDVAQAPATSAELARYEHPRDRARVHYELRAHLDGATDEHNSEYRVRTAGGRVRWVIARGRVIARGPDGRALAYRGTLQDVTEPIEMQRELQRQLAKSREAALVSEGLVREVRRLEAEIREVSQREHERIGHDLHDGLAQELTGVSLLLKTLEDAIARDAPQLTTRVHSVRDMVEKSISTVRALALGLSPVHLDRDGFAAALQQLCASSEALYGIPVKFCGRLTGHLLGLAAAADLYRIAQEAIRNAARHSAATEIRLTLAADDERLTLTIEDNGGGIVPAAETRGGMGMKIMRYRASIIGALLEIGARKHGGTIVRCVLRQAAEGDTPGEKND
jgi:PAS domain S-box-containing protein